MRRFALATFAAGLLALTGCVHVHEHDHHHGGKGGPPPWAPAHGYRHKHHGADLRFDAHLGVYVVVGHPHIYFHDGHYLRRAHSSWERCGDWKKGRWKPVDVRHVPGPLVKHYAAKGPKHGKGKDKGKGKGKGKGGPAKPWD
jgi:hypothetical protein